MALFTEQVTAGVRMLKIYCLWLKSSFCAGESVNLCTRLNFLVYAILKSLRFSGESLFWTHIFVCNVNASMESSTVPEIDWLYPELLSKYGLIEVLSQRFVKLPDDVESTTKDSLLELYYRYILPRPQRQYRLNRRGRDMTRKQLIRAKKRKATEKNSSEPTHKKPSDGSSRLLTSFDGISLGSRLKPPPSCINSEKKVIKLGSSRSSGDSSDAPHITSTSPTTGSKIIRLNRTSSSSSQEEVKFPTVSKTITHNKTVKLINCHISGSGDASGNGAVKTNMKQQSEVSTKEQPSKEKTMDTDENPSPPKKPVKIKRIAWP